MRRRVTDDDPTTLFPSTAETLTSPWGATQGAQVGHLGGGRAQVIDEATGSCCVCHRVSDDEIRTHRHRLAIEGPTGGIAAQRAQVDHGGGGCAEVVGEAMALQRHQGWRSFRRRRRRPAAVAEDSGPPSVAQVDHGGGGCVRGRRRTHGYRQWLSAKPDDDVHPPPRWPNCSRRRGCPGRSWWGWLRRGRRRTHDGQRQQRCRSCPTTISLSTARGLAPRPRRGCRGRS